MTSVLLIGTDNFVDDNKQYSIEAHYNSNLSDFLVLLVFDHSAKTITPFQICRDTMCQVPVLSVNGKVADHAFEQITYAHTYGSGKEDSSVNTRNTVSDLLFGLPITHYFRFTMDAVPVLNDLVGGVTVRLTESIPALGPAYVRGASITLKGSAALKFVRYRDLSQVDSNLLRMENHRIYLEAFEEAARAALEENEDFAVNAFKTVQPFLCTDLSVENISDITEYMRTYELKPTVTPDGEYVMGEMYAEYYVSSDSLWECVRDTFCI